jgi:hypothetical protein
MVLSMQPQCQGGVPECLSRLQTCNRFQTLSRALVDNEGNSTEKVCGTTRRIGFLHFLHLRSRSLDSTQSVRRILHARFTGFEFHEFLLDTLWDNVSMSHKVRDITGNTAMSLAQRVSPSYPTDNTRVPAKQRHSARMFAREK